MPAKFLVRILSVTPSVPEGNRRIGLPASSTKSFDERRTVIEPSKDFVDEAGNPIPAIPSGTEGVTLKILTKNFAVPIPELLEA